MNIRTRLRALILVTLLPVGLFGIAGAYFIVQKERQTMEEGMRDRAMALMTAVETEIQASIDSLQVLARSPALQNNDVAAFRAEAQLALATRNGTWGNIVLFDVQGQQMMNMLLPPPAVLPRSRDMQGVIEVAQHRRPALGKIRMAVILKRPVFSLRIPVVRGNEAIYVLTAVVDADAIARIVEKQSIPASWTVAVLDQDYRFVFRRPALEKGNEFASDTLRAVLSSASQGWERGRLLDGTPIYRAYQRSSVGNWTASVAVPRSIVDQSLRSLWMLIGGFALAAVLGLWIAWHIASRISRPIAALAAAGPALSRGEVSAIPPPGPVNEVRQLSQALSEAAVAIRARSEQQRQAEQALRAADRAKDEFLAMLGHELRNPLSSVSNAAELLKLARDPATLENVSAILERQVEHMTRLVDDLLEVGRVTGGKIRLELEPLDLAQLVGDLVDAWHSGNRFAHHTVIHHGQGVWVLADRARTEQILSNLLDNALKYTPAGGHIEVAVFREGEDAILQVTDSGEGMSPELIERVFDLFVQGERSLARELGGLGIGLTMAKRLVELQGGAINVSSEGPSKGACFTVLLPAIQDPIERRPAPSPTPSSAKAQRVLIIEDDNDARESLAALLRASAHEVRLAATGSEGLDLAATQAFDLALIDIGLPDVDGYEVARRLREAPVSTNMRLIALTGYGMQDDRRRALAAGFDEHIAKPVGMDVLRKLLEPQ